MDAGLSGRLTGLLSTTPSRVKAISSSTPGHTNTARCQMGSTGNEQSAYGKSRS